MACYWKYWRHLKLMFLYSINFEVCHISFWDAYIEQSRKLSCLAIGMFFILKFFHVCFQSVDWKQFLVAKIVNSLGLCACFTFKVYKCSIVMLFIFIYVLVLKFVHKLKYNTFLCNKFTVDCDSFKYGYKDKSKICLDGIKSLFVV